MCFFNQNITSASKFLIVFPHPDDEVFACGGLMQKLLKENVSVKLMILTKGEASTLRNGLAHHEDLAKKRTGEFESVCRYLGIIDFSIHDFVDGGIKSSNLEVKKFLQNILAQYKPDFVVTYEPSGIYGHPDHIALSKICAELCDEVGFKLIYATVPETFNIPSEGLKMAEDPAQVKPLKPNFIVRLNAIEWLKKLKMFSFYKSQVNVKREVFTNIKNIYLMSKEYFYTIN